MRLPPLRIVAASGLFIAAAIGLDQWVKHMVETHMPLGSHIELLPFLALFHTRNEGIAFSMFSGSGMTLLSVVSLGVIALMLWLWSKAEATDRLAHLGFALILAGAIGNLVDRLMLGYVTDYVFFHTPVWSFAVFNLADYVVVFIIMCPIIVISGLNTVPWALLNRDLSFRPRAVSELLRDGTRLVLTLILVLHYDLGIWGVVWGFVASRTVWTVVTWIATRYKPILAWERSIVKELFAYAWRMAGNRFLGLLALNGDYFVVGNRTSSLDLYYQAFRLPEIVMGGQLNAMSAVLFPMYSRIRTEGPDALRSAMYRALRIVGLFSIPVGIGLALVARDVITVMFGTGDSAAVPTMELISLTGCVTGLGFATGDLLYAINRPGLLMRINLVMVPTMLATMWFVAPHGIEWVAFTHLCIQAVFVTIRQVVVNGLVGASMMKVVLSCGPGVVVATGVLVFALPVRLLTDAGALSGLLVTLAGAVGAALALAVSPPARTELMELVAKVRGN